MNWDILQRHGARRYSGTVTRVLSPAFFTAPAVREQVCFYVLMERRCLGFYCTSPLHFSGKERKET